MRDEAVMDQVEQNSAIIIAIAICSGVVCCTKWLIDSEQRYPRDANPVIYEDQSRGAFYGTILGAVWVIVDVILSHYWQRPIWILAAWEIRFSMCVALILGGYFTLGEVFRVLRCRKAAEPHASYSNKDQLC